MGKPSSDKTGGLLIPNMTSICTPKDIANKTINYESIRFNYGNKLKNNKIKSYKKIGDLYIKNKSLKERNYITESKLLNYKRNKNNVNPFNCFSYEIEKFPIIKKVNYYIENIYDKNKKNKDNNDKYDNKNSKTIQCNNILNFKSSKDINKK